MFYFGTRSFTAFVNLKISLYFFLLNSWRRKYGILYSYPLCKPLNYYFDENPRRSNVGSFKIKYRAMFLTFSMIFPKKILFEIQIKKWVALINLQLWYELRKSTKLTNSIGPALSYISVYKSQEFFVLIYSLHELQEPLITP